MGSNTQNPYGSSAESPERAYLSRLQALAVNTGLRGKMNGMETVDQLFALLFETPRGERSRREIHGGLRGRQFHQGKLPHRCASGTSDSGGPLPVAGSN